ncbi:MAG: NADPH:quinone oxidoreductase family protein, partial [Actinomyces sp.]
VDAPPVGTPVVMAGGGLAELVAVPAGSVHPYPAEALDPARAAAIPINYGTAWYALFERAHLAAGEWLLVTGAGGGTGTAAIQLARSVGARIVAVVGGTAKAELVESLGVDAVIDHHRTPEWVEAVRDLTGGGVDVAFDPVGGDTFTQVRRSMGWGGRALVIGFVAGIPQIPANHVLLKNYSVVGVHWGASLMRDPASLGRQLEAVFALARDGVVDPPLYPPVPFEEASRALQDLAERRVWGKAVVTVT